MRLELHRRIQMLRHVLPVVPARINMSFVRHMAGGQQFIELARPRVKAIIVLLAAVEINLQSLQVCSSGKDERGVFPPEAFIGRRAKGGSQKRAQPGAR